MKVLHVASFAGNVGDIANHSGFRSWFERLIGSSVKWTDFEIRDTYRGKKTFDAEFASKANEHDLLIFGGGGFFEAWVESSPTGTSISLSEAVLSDIKIPIFFNSLGCCLDIGYTKDTVRKFKKFLQNLRSSAQYLVTVRNDGTLKNLQLIFGDPKFLENVLVVPDGGFFVQAGELSLGSRSSSRIAIGINVASDMEQVRFPGTKGLHSYDSYIAEFTEALESLAAFTGGGRLKFFPQPPAVASAKIAKNERLAKSRNPTLKQSR